MTRIIFDAVQLLFQNPLLPVSEKTYTLKKAPCSFIADSYEECTKKLLSGPFLQELLDFSEFEKDNINEETIELLEPYLTLKNNEGEAVYTPEIAKKASAALAGLCTWSAAMSDYYKASKVVKPKMKLLELKAAALEEAQAKLASAQAELDEVNALKAGLKKKFDDEMAKKQALQDKAMKTKKKMDQANRLINSLEDNKIRWKQNKENFKKEKLQLVGDVAKACAFVSYCGPFNSEFRNLLTNQYFE